MAKKPLLTTATTVHTPMIPNFIRIGDTQTTKAIAEFTDEELENIGKQWTKELIALAQKRRAKTT